MIYIRKTIKKVNTQLSPFIVSDHSLELQHANSYATVEKLSDRLSTTEPVR